MTIPTCTGEGSSGRGRQLGVHMGCGARSVVEGDGGTLSRGGVGVVPDSQSLVRTGDLTVHGMSSPRSLGLFLRS